MCKKLFYLSFFLFTFSCAVAFAQNSQGIVVATLNIYNAQIVSQSNRDFNLSFDISNTSGVQPNIQYAIEIIKTINGKNLVFDEYVYPGMFSVAEGEVVHENIQYHFPDSLPSGTYQLVIESKNTSDLPLAVDLVGNITISSTVSQSVEIVPDSCSFVVSTSAGKESYLSDDIFSFSPIGSTLTATCQIDNTFPSTLTLIPNIQTHVRSLFGNLVPEASSTQSSVTVETGIHTLSIPIPYAQDPQQYNASLALTSTDTTITSNSVYFQYFLTGLFGTIQNVIFDKSAYSAGDIAQVKIFSVLGETSTSTELSLVMKDQQGNICGQTTFTPNSNTSFIATTLSIPIQISCINPTAEVKFFSNTKTLDTLNMNIISTQGDIAHVTKSQTTKETMEIIITLGILLILLFLFVCIMKKKRIKSTSVLSAVILLLFFGLGSRVHALTYEYPTALIPISANCDMELYGITFTINTDKSSYVSGSTINVTGETTNSSWAWAPPGYYCPSNPSQIAARTNMAIDGVHIDNTSPSYNFATTVNTPSSLIFTAPTSVGSHVLNANFVDTDFDTYYGGSGTPYSYNESFSDQTWGAFGFTVTPFATISATVGTTTASAIPAGSTTNISWISSGIASATITVNNVTTPWIVPHYITVASTTPATYSCSSQNGITTCTVLTATSTAYTQVLDQEISDSTTSPAISVGANTFTFNGYANGVLAITQSVNVYGTTTQSNPPGQHASDSIIAAPVEITPGAASVITWASTNANSCSVNEGSKLAWQTGGHGNIASDPLTATTTFTINCIGSDNETVSTSTIVGVSAASNQTQSPPVTPPTITVESCTPTQINTNGIGNIYADKTVSWGMNLTGILGNTVWSGTGIASTTTNSLTFNTLYTTIGQKFIYATTTDSLTGNLYTCFATTTIRIPETTINNI